MDCPACIEQLVVVEFLQIEVDICLMGCQGVWLDAGELSHLRGGAPEEPFQVVQPRDDSAPLRCCPRCERPMQVGYLQGQGPLLDHCPAGHGFWLDAGELQTLLTAPIADQHPPPLHFLYTLFAAKE